MKLRIFCWWLSLAAFTVIGLIRWTQKFVSTPPSFHRPDAALDALASQRFDLDDGAATLRHELSAFAPDAPLLLVGPGNDWTITEAYFALSYLAYPRPVWCLGIMPPGQTAPYGNPPPPGFQAAGLFLYKTQPPPDLSARKLSKRLAVGKTTP